MDYYALRLEGSDCRLCHTDAQHGSLSPTGIAFQENGYRYPLLGQSIFFDLVGISVIVLILLGLRRRYRLWSLGRPQGPVDQITKRVKGLFLYGLANRKVLASPLAGVSHLLLFGGIVLLCGAVSVVMLQEYLYLPWTGGRLFDASSYPILRLFLDLSGSAGWLGTIWLGLRRYGLRPRALDRQRRDLIALLLLFLVFLTGFLTTGTRNLLYHSSYSRWSPVASAIASLLLWLFSGPNVLLSVFRLLWWVHYLLSLILLCYIPFSGLLHLFTSPLSIFLRTLEPKGCLTRIDLDSAETYGAGRIEDFTRKDLMELDACTRCGRCQEQCPAFLSGKALNPKEVIQKLKRHMEQPLTAGEKAYFFTTVVTEEETWQCTTCRNCLEHCPVFIEPMTKLIELRRYLVLSEGRMPRETRFAFRNIERKGNPWGFDASKRMSWTKAFRLRELEPKEEVDLLYWVGCYGSYDDRNISVAKALIHLLHAAGLEFGVLGSREWCCGIDLRRMGNEYLYQMTAERNIAELRRVKFRALLTSCPHCYNTLKNEYPQFGGRFEVIHHTTLIDQLIQDGKIPLIPKTATDNRATKITYHDSCYLGRYNEGFDAPRKILDRLAGVKRLEMARHHEASFCCGGGGCHMWMEEKVGKRINQMRAEMAAETGAEILATVCPLCMISLDSALKVLNLDERLRVMDIVELVAERLKENEDLPPP